MKQAIPKTIDITPKWVDVLPLYLEVLQNPNSSEKGRKAAISEIQRMAELSDFWVEHLKSTKKGPIEIDSSRKFFQYLNQVIDMVQEMESKGIKVKNTPALVYEFQIMGHSVHFSLGYNKRLEKNVLGLIIESENAFEDEDGDMGHCIVDDEEGGDTWYKALSKLETRFEKFGRWEKMIELRPKN